VNTFKLWNRSFGWGIFVIALFTYGFTVEPTASFWDAGEYIATSAKLQVGHPPGAPLFQMMGAFFAMFATSPEKVALMVNFMSVFSSAFTILFLFWTLTLLLKKLPAFKTLETTNQRITFFGSATVGALVFCFSDSFWFNAVEAEVYAMATFILSLIFWLALRWEQDMHEPRGDRWLLLISFIIGLSFGVHFMGLLTIPALGMIYFFNNTKSINFKNFLIANIISVAILLFIFKLLLPTTLAFFGKSEVFFVNNIGLPFNSGTIIAGICFLLFFFYFLRFTEKKKWVNLNTITLCILFVLVGFSSWLMIPIRANANTVINENSPTDARALLAYYNLEQYPETHLFYGPLFSDVYAGQDETEPYFDDKPKYERDYKKGEYIIVNHWEKARINSNSNHRGFLPRLWSSEHAGNYMNFTGPLEFTIAPEYRSNQMLVSRVNDFRNEIREGMVTGDDYHQFFRTLSPYLQIEKPSFWSSLQFLFQYQIGYMYWRYFMWNFTGRQNDIAGTYDTLNGNWISGINLFDSLRLGNQSEISEDAKNNKARNTYFFLPFLLGLIGLYFLYQQDPNRFWVLLLFFLFTGLALKIYLNERPFEPRERDYALVGSFYVFAIWIGMGVFALAHKIKVIIKSNVAPLATVVLCLFVPFLMAYQNWDDHDRSGRYTAQSMAKSYLESIQEDAGAMIFTIGDNDTFALWYAQEIEGYRTDVKTINTSLLATDWYIDQMKRKTYESESIPSQMTHDLYAYGIRDYIKHESLIDSVRWDIKDFINWVASDHPRTKYKSLLLQAGEDPNRLPMGTQEMIFYPTNKIRVPVNKENVIKSGLVKPKDYDLIVPYIDIDLPEGGMTKNQIMMLDILANNDWERPIYFTGGSYADSEYMWMKEYLQLEGLVYKLVPIRTPLNSNNPYIMGRLDSDLMYDIVMKWSWGNSESTSIYHDPETRKNSISFRSNMARLAEKLIDEGKNKKAKEVLDLAIHKMPLDYFGYYSLVVPMIDTYYRLDAVKSAQQLALKVGEKYRDEMEYFSSLKPSQQYLLGEEIITQAERYRTLMEAVLVNKDKILLSKSLNQFIEAITPFVNLYGEYDFYTSLSMFVEGYYLAGEQVKAKNLIEDIAKQYEGRFAMIANFSQNDQQLVFDRIKEEILDFQQMIDLVKNFDQDQADSLQLRFDKSMSQFKINEKVD
tara:strand:- start:498 stop:4028 length:3531 start_codon:yes stop_codon:yes gene_type:complete